VGEAGGKDFIFVHNSSDAREIAVSIIRGAFGFQGQKCSAASRIYIPESLWIEVKKILLDELPKLEYGPVDDLGNFMGAVIDRDAFEKITGYIKYAKEHKDEYEFVYGGRYDSSKGWFIEPTVIKTTNPKGKLMVEEIFGPVVTVYTYADKNYLDTLKLCDSTSPYSLTGAILAKDKEAVATAEKILRYSAGNFYINEKPTGAIVGRQPFGGTRASGTNDKAGSWLNILRWLNPRTIKETTTPAREWTFEFMKK
jgi:1-pyrroline-5-carboxylate dehydrogenase